ncbi:hypothetical protein HRbin07_00397 [bacterium HR07]|nr:hypothetical protein HRbin07_00397 [bacterium HR07]
MGAQIIAVALLTDATADGAAHGRADDDERAHTNRLDLEGAQLLCERPGDRLVLGDHDKIRVGIADILSGLGPHNFFIERAVAGRHVGGEIPKVVGLLAVEDLAALHERLSQKDNIVGQDSPVNALFDRLHHFVGLGVVERVDLDALGGAAVFFFDDELFGGVDEASRQIPGVGGLQRRIGGPFAAAVRTNKVLDDVEALTEIGDDRHLDDSA